MKELKVQKKPEKTKAGSYSEREPAQSHAHETDYIGSGYQPPEKFAPLVQKLSNPANTTPRAQLLTRLQRSHGNRYVQKVLQPKLKVGHSGDIYEREANRIAEVVEKLGTGEMPVNNQIQSSAMGSASEEDGASQDVLQYVESQKNVGQSLSTTTRAFFEPRFGHDLSQVRLHTNLSAAKTAASLGARAFTCGTDIWFGHGQDPADKKLLAHELTHVLQQAGGSDVRKSPKLRSTKKTPREGSETSVAINMNSTTIQQETGHVPIIQCIVEVRPPGPGEYSAFDRRQELVDRLNRQSPATQYRLEGQVLRYDAVHAANLTNFDRRMRAFIDNTQVVPMRLITSAGRVGGATIEVDAFFYAYVDLDDLLASSDIAFQNGLLHLLTERFNVPNYWRRILSGSVTLPRFMQAHRAAIEAEAENLRNIIGDPTIRHIYDEERSPGVFVRAYRSREGYHVFEVFRGRTVIAGEVWVQTRDRRRLTIEQLRAERAAARAPAAAPAVP